VSTLSNSDFSKIAFERIAAIAVASLSQRDGETHADAQHEVIKM
jgi:hypothetical protein